LAAWVIECSTEIYEATVTLLVFSALMVVFAAANWWYLWDQNKKKSVIRLRETKMAREEEDMRLGDKSAWFEYNL